MITRLFKHTPVELDPAQFAVEVGRPEGWLWIRVFIKGFIEYTHGSISACAVVCTLYSIEGELLRAKVLRDE